MVDFTEKLRQLQGRCMESVEEASHGEDTLQLWWLAALDDLHAAARETAETKVLLEEWSDRGASLATSLQDQLCQNQASKLHLDDVRLSRCGESEAHDAQASSLEDALNHALAEQLKLRSAVRVSMESAARAGMHAETASARCEELEHQLQDSTRICAELVQERGRKVEELEASCLKSTLEARRLQEYLENKGRTAQLHPAGLERRQRYSSLLATPETGLPDSRPADEGAKGI